MSEIFDLYNKILNYDSKFKNIETLQVLEYIG
jgi:hypothetical protein